MDQEAMEPGVEPGWFAQARQAAPGRHERFLDGIVSARRVVEKEAGGAAHAPDRGLGQ
jgi:hypothetical protein